MKKSTEADILSACLQLLQIRGVFAFRVNNTGVRRRDAAGREFWAFNGVKGISDLFAILPPWSTHPGVLCAIECKRPGGKLTAAQSRFLANVQDQGGIACVVKDVVVLDELLTDWGC